MTINDFKRYEKINEAINYRSMLIINTIKQLDVDVLTFGKHSVYKYNNFFVDLNEEKIRVEYFDWLDDCFDFDYIEVPFKDFIGNIEQFCEKYVKEIREKEEIIKKISTKK
jgi:hypothetical protein